jgi:hypothetical protein
MSKSRIALVTLLGIAVIATAAVSGEEQAGKPWFDLDNCAICKNLKAEEGLLEHMKWETHLISSGSLSVAVIPADYEPAFERAGKNMEAVVKRMEGGEQVNLCGFCTSYGQLMMAGAKSEEIHSIAGHISMTTSDKPEVVEKIHAHAKTTIDEFKKWMEAKKAAHEHGEKGEHGHTHN